MSDKSTYIKEALQKLPDLKSLEMYLEQDIDVIVEQVLPRELSRGHGLESINSQPLSPPPGSRSSKRQQDQTALANYLAAGKQALQKIRKDGTSANLDKDETDGLESIILAFGRPAIHIQQGSFFNTPNWDILEQERLAIEQTCRSVGRIEVYKDDASGYIGTGFLVAKDVVITTKHVAKLFCRDLTMRWVIQSSMVTCIDYLRELESYESFEFELVDVIDIHNDLDLALLRTSLLSRQGYSIPTPLVLARHAPHVRAKSLIYTVGHPSWDGYEDDPGTVYRIFAEPHGVKRLQPGQICGIFPDYGMFTHDCSTLTGNSGSCVIDLRTHKVLGLHFKGQPRQINWAVALWMLEADPLLQKAGIWFG